MSRTPKNPQNDPPDWSIALAGMKRRAGVALPVKLSPNLADYLVPSTMQFYATVLVFNRELLWRDKRTYRTALDKEHKAKCHAYNNRPDVAAKRGAYYKERFKDPAYSLARKEENAEYYIKNKEAILVRNNKWEAENKDHVRAYMTKYTREKRQTKPWWNIRNRLASRLWHAVTLQNGTKAYKTQELIGCTVSALRVQLESQFTVGMTWELFLHGKIHIDHRVPCISFDLTDPAEQKKCFHHSNLQPLWALDNLKKSDTLASGNERDHGKLKTR